MASPSWRRRLRQTLPRRFGSALGRRRAPRGDAPVAPVAPHRPSRLVLVSGVCAALKAARVRRAQKVYLQYNHCTRDSYCARLAIHNTHDTRTLGPGAAALHVPVPASERSARRGESEAKLQLRMYSELYTRRILRTFGYSQQPQTTLTKRWVLGPQLRCARAARRIRSCNSECSPSLALALRPTWRNDGHLILGRTKFSVVVVGSPVCWVSRILPARRQRDGPLEL